jgi:hypothetical protein
MTVHSSTLHVVFGPSAAGTLRQALTDAGRNEEVVSPYDDFSFGPIADDDANTRAKWVEDVLGCTDWQDVFDNSLPVLTASELADRTVIAWVSPTTTSSVAGYLWWLSHIGDRAFDLLEIPDLNTLPADRMTAYFERATPVSAERRKADIASWERLKAENAPLRIMTRSGLVSAPLDVFDATLLGNARKQWRKAALIVGMTLGDFIDGAFFQTGDLVLFARLVSLAEAGVLEWQGDLAHMRNCEMRLPSGE